MSDEPTPDESRPTDPSTPGESAPDVAATPPSETTGDTSYAPAASSGPPTNEGRFAAMRAGGQVSGGTRKATTGPPAKRRNFFRRHLALTTLGVLLLLIVGSFGGFIWYLNHELGNIPRVTIGNLDPATKPDGSGAGSSDSGKPLNILVLGADNGDAANTVANELADGSWSPGSHRSDTIMLVHIPADRKSAQVISIPRDSWVPVPGFPGDIGGEAKINAAFSWGGPELAVRTIKDFTGLPINHVAMIDWTGFKDLTNALGGVRIYIPETFTDDSQNVTWQQGWQTLNGDQALQYVRTRHGLANGDFGRIQRQQNFIRTVLASVISSTTTHNPIKLASVVSSLGSFLTLDSGWSNSDLRSLAIGSRNMSNANIQFTTAPFGSYDTVGGQSIVRLDPVKCKSLFTQFSHGDISTFLDANPESSLPNNQSVK